MSPPPELSEQRPAAPRPHAAEPRSIDVLQLLAPLRRHWLRFLLLWALVGGLLLACGVHLSPGFRAEGRVRLDSTSDRTVGGSDQLNGVLSMLGGHSDLDSEKEVLKTNELALNIIRELGINARLEGPARDLPERPFLWQYYLDRDPNRFARGLYVHDTDTAERVYRQLRYTLRFSDATHFEILDAGDHDKPLGTAQLAQPATTPDAHFTLDAYTPVPIEPPATFTLTLQPAQLLLPSFNHSLTIEGGGRQPRTNNVIEVGFTSGSPLLAQRVVDRLLNEFVELNRRWATSTAHAVVEFVSSELTKLRADMNTSTARLAEYQAKSGMVALDKQEEEEVKKLVAAEVEQSKHKIAIMQAEQLGQRLESGRPDTYVLSFVGDQLLEALGNQLTEVNGKIDALALQYKDDYPPLADLKTVRARLLKDMQASVSNYLDRERLGLAQSAEVIETYKANFGGVPEKARALADFQRATQVFQNLYVFLVQEQQRAQIAEGSTLSNIRVIDHAFVPIRESWPGNVLLVVMCATLGLLVSGGLVVLPALRVHWFSSVEEVKEAFSQPVFAVVPSRGRGRGRGRGTMPSRSVPAILETRLQGPFIEAIRLLRANLQHTMGGRHHQAVLITSAMPQDGKSTVIANLATTLARSTRVDRVLLIDADMHHPSLHGVFALPQSPGLSDFLNGSATLAQVTRTLDLGAGRQLDVICAGPVPPSPLELIDSQPMQDLLAQARDRYTFTLLDSPPYPLITTASVLAPLVDRVLCVCRLGRTDRDIFRTHVGDLAALCKHVGLIINASHLGKSYGAEYGGGYTQSGNGGAESSRPTPVPPAKHGAPGNGAPGNGADQGHAQGNRSADRTDAITPTPRD